MRVYTTNEAAMTVMRATKKEISDGKIRVWNQRGHMPYLNVRLSDWPRGIVEPHVHQIALQTQLVAAGLAVSSAGEAALLFVPIKSEGDIQAEKKNFMGIGFFADGKNRYRRENRLGDFDRVGQWIGDPLPKGVKLDVLITIDCVDLVKRVRAALTELFPDEAE
jgi:hypothetical protein